MVYRIYKDKKLICASEDKHKAFKIMRESFTPGAHYYVETEDNGVKEREQYYLSERFDGRICVNKRSSTEKNRDKSIEDGKIKKAGIWLNDSEYKAVETAANNSDMTVSSYIKFALIEKLHSESYL